MRKISALLLTSTLVLSLCACGNTVDDSTKNNVNQISPDTTVVENVEVEKDNLNVEPDNVVETENKEEEKKSSLDIKEDNENILEDVKDDDVVIEEDDSKELNSEVKVLEYGDLVINIPKDVMDLVTIKEGVSDENGHVWNLFDIYETKSIEAGQKVHPGEDWGDGWLFGISVADQIGFEEMSGWDPTGFSIFAKYDDKYYIYNHPTDVRLMREDNDYQSGIEEWSMLCDWAYQMKDVLIKDNDLESISVMYSDYTYDSEHRYFKYEDEWSNNVIVLSQPVQQGSNGIWCVERVEEYYDGKLFNTRLIFPISMGIEKTAHQYYVELQDLADNGQNVDSLKVEKVLEDFLNSDAWYYRETTFDALVEIEK